MANKTPALRRATLLLMSMCFLWGWEVLARTLGPICAHSRWVGDRRRIFDREREPLLVAIGDSLQAVAPLILFAAVCLLIDAAPSYEAHTASGATDLDAGRASFGRRARPDQECGLRPA
jgi:hypothetical protein